MKNEEVEQWLIKEAKNKNSLAQTYLSLMQNAAPEMRSHFMSQLGTMLEVIQAYGPEIRKQMKSEN